MAVPPAHEMNLWLKNNINLCLDKSALGRLSYTVDQPFFVCLLKEVDMGQLGPSLPMEKLKKQVIRA